MDSEQEQANCEGTVDGASCLTSSHSSNSSVEDFFQINTTELGKPAMALGETPSDCVQEKEAGVYFSKEHEMKDAPVLGGNPFSNCSYDPPPHGNVCADDPGTAGLNQCPKVQLMCRSDVPDPNRIPSSVFARNKSGTPVEWSVASNESLFSIPMKSGELTGMNSNYLDYCPSVSYCVGISPGEGRVVSALQQIVEAPNAEAMKDAPEEATAEESREKEKPAPVYCSVPHSDSISQRSDGGSVTSHHSFAFPILALEERNKSCKVVPDHHQPQQPLPKTEPTEAESISTTPRKSWLSCFCFSICC